VVVVVVLVEVLVVLVVVLVVASTVSSIKLLHNSLTDLTSILVVPSGTTVDVYPANKTLFSINSANGSIYPLTFEYKLNGPVSISATVNVINNVILFDFIQL
jgi:hypothetical protein